MGTNWNMGFCLNFGPQTFCNSVKNDQSVVARELFRNGLVTDGLIRPVQSMHTHMHSVGRNEKVQVLACILVEI